VLLTASFPVRGELLTAPFESPVLVAVLTALLEEADFSVERTARLSEEDLTIPDLFATELS
jgi:hypothetical protein